MEGLAAEVWVLTTEIEERVHHRVNSVHRGRAWSAASGFGDLADDLQSKVGTTLPMEVASVPLATVEPSGANRTAFPARLAIAECGASRSAPPWDPHHESVRERIDILVPYLVQKMLCG